MKKFLLLLIAWIFLISCTSEKSSTDIVNPDAEFLYFYWATCPHCQELNRMLEEGDYLSKISLEKREVYYNDVNRDSFLEVTQKLGLSEKDTWVPFVLEKSTGKFVTGVTPAFELLTSKLWEDENNNDIVDITETKEEMESDEVVIDESEEEVILPISIDE